MIGVDVISGGGGFASDGVFFLVSGARELVFTGGLQGIVELIVGHAITCIPTVNGLAKQVVLVGFDGFGKPVTVRYSLETVSAAVPPILINSNWLSAHFNVWVLGIYESVRIAFNRNYDNASLTFRLSKTADVLFLDFRNPVVKFWSRDIEVSAKVLNFWV